jgi:hypothetical protein
MLSHAEFFELDIARASINDLKESSGLAAFDRLNHLALRAQHLRDQQRQRRDRSKH